MDNISHHVSVGFFNHRYLMVLIQKSFNSCRLDFNCLVYKYDKHKQGLKFILVQLQSFLLLYAAFIVEKLYVGIVLTS